MEEKIVPGYALDLIVEEHKTEKKRLWIALLIVFIALVGSNTAWLIYENSFEDVVTTSTVTQEAQSDSGNATVNGQNAGVIYNGTSETDDNNND